MINVVFSSNLFLSLVFILALFLLYGLKIVRPEVSREEDMGFILLGLFYSGILAVHGWRLDPILIFSQTLIIVIVLFLGWENIRLRGLLTDMDKRKQALQRVLYQFDREQMKRNQKPKSRK